MLVESNGKCDNTNYVKTQKCLIEPIENGSSVLQVTWSPETLTVMTNFMSSTVMSRCSVDIGMDKEGSILTRHSRFHRLGALGGE